MRHGSWGGSTYAAGFGFTGTNGFSGIRQAIDDFLGPPPECSFATFGALAVAAAGDAFAVYYSVRAVRALSQLRGARRTFQTQGITGRRVQRTIGPLELEVGENQLKAFLSGAGDNLLGITMAAGTGYEGIRTFADFFPGIGTVTALADVIRAC
jgi:hypothetical protein